MMFMIKSRKLQLLSRDVICEQGESFGAFQYSADSSHGYGRSLTELNVSNSNMELELGKKKKIKIFCISC